MRIPRTRKEWAAEGREWLKTIVIVLIIFLPMITFVVQGYCIPSGSMEDTLLIGDRVLVDRISWRFTEPERREIVVFHPPFAGPVLIKRIIGMPGDTISLEGGDVYVNGEKLDEPYVRVVDGQKVPTEPFDNGLPWALQRPYKVPAGNYFVMGDNRIDSGDSREFGPVPRGQLVGSAFARYWPPSRIGGVD